MKGRRRKIITRVIVFLLLGAIVNVAVAWGLALWVYPGTIVPEVAIQTNQSGKPWWGVFRHQATGVTRVRSIAGEMSEARPILRESVPCADLIPLWASALQLSDDNELPRVAFADMRGWPLGSLGCVCRLEFTPNGIEIGTCHFGIRLQQYRTNNITRLPLNDNACRILPLMMLWPGFAINTIFYAATLWLLFFAPGSVRRTLRRGRGLCPACAYPVGTSPVCTECGKPVNKRSAVSNQRSEVRNAR